MHLSHTKTLDSDSTKWEQATQKSAGTWELREGPVSNHTPIEPDCELSEERPQNQETFLHPGSERRNKQVLGRASEFYRRALEKACDAV